MAGTPELVIPVRLSPGEAASALRQIGKAGQAAGDAVAGGMGKAQAGAAGVTSELANLMKAQVGMAAIKQVAGAIGDQMRQTSEYVAEQAKHFQELRKAMQAVASLTGGTNTNKFTLGEISKAQAANLTPQEFAEGKKALLDKAGKYIGAGPDAKIDSDEADKLQQRLGEFAKSKGIGQADIGSFTGAILQQTKGKTNAKEMEARIGKLYATLEAASTDPQKLIPGMTEVMAGGMAPEAAAASISQMPEIAPGQEATYLNRTIMELQQQIREGKIGEEQGVKKGMAPRDMLKAMVKNLAGRQAKGEDLDDAIASVTTQDIPMKTLKGLVGAGPAAMESWDKMIEDTPADVVDKSLGASRVTEPGRLAHDEAAAAAASARLGSRNEIVQRMRQNATTALQEGGQLEHSQMMDRGKALLPFSDDMKTQQVNRQMIYNARAQLGQAPGAGDMVAAQNRGLTDELMLKLIDEMKQMNAKMPDLERQPPPLVKPPMPRDRM